MIIIFLYMYNNFQITTNRFILCLTFTYSVIENVSITFHLITRVAPFAKLLLGIIVTEVAAGLRKVVTEQVLVTTFMIFLGFGFLQFII